MSDSNCSKINTKEYYGKILNNTNDLKTNACCTISKYPKFIKDILNQINEEVLSTYYGCGLIIPDILKDLNIVDLGCGSGRDVYILSKLVGENGFVKGVDMTPEQLEIANKNIIYHMEKFGYKTPNVEFINDEIDKINSNNLNKINNNLVDIVVSNCVVNLCTNKEAVFKNVYNMLKIGGEMYFSDVYSDRRIPEYLCEDKVLWGECLSGALYINDFISIVKGIGFKDPRIISCNKITIKNKELEKKIGNIKFYSITYRLFKLPDSLDDNCEDYGQLVKYKGTIKNFPNIWSLDSNHNFESGKYQSVCRNTFNMLYLTRFKDHFEFIGTNNTHFGIFPNCGNNNLFNTNKDNNLKNEFNLNCC